MLIAILIKLTNPRKLIFLTLANVSVCENFKGLLRCKCIIEKKQKHVDTVL